MEWDIVERRYKTSQEIEDDWDEWATDLYVSLGGDPADLEMDQEEIDRILKSIT